MSIIFLDVDGVLNNAADVRRGIELESEKLQLFSDLIRATGSKVVLSSSWRLNTTSFDEVESTLLDYGVTVADCTPPSVAIGPYGKTSTRGDEIEMWLFMNMSFGDHYAILDDVDDGLSVFGPNFFQTSFKIGLTLDICNAIIHHLNKETITSEDVGDLDGLLKGAL